LKTTGESQERKVWGKALKQGARLIGTKLHTSQAERAGNFNSGKKDGSHKE